MIIAVPVENLNDPKTAVYGHFGSAPGYALYDSETKNYKYLSNAEQEHTHGQCQPTELLKNEKVGAVLCGGMGARAVGILNQLGVEVFLVEEVMPLEKAIELYLKKGLARLSLENACSHHSCH